MDGTPVTVTYGTFDFTTSFGGMPVPYVSRSQEVLYEGKKWGQATSLTLNGTIIGSSGVKAGSILNYEALDFDRNKILYEFSKDYKPLQIKEGGVLLTGYDYCIVNSVDFEAGNQGKLDYSIELSCFDEKTWIAHQGVLEPVDEYSMNQVSATDIEITHKVSARGYQNDTAPLQNAINFVNSRTGVQAWNASSRWLIPPANCVLKTITKDVNRPNASYSVTETYVAQTGDISVSRGGGTSDAFVPFVAGTIQEINTSFSSGVNQDFSTVSVDYSIRGGKKDSAATLRSTIPDSGVLFDIANSAMPALTESKVYLRPVSYSVNDLADTEHKIDISAEYTDNFIGQINNSSVTGAIYWDYTIDYSTDAITNVTSLSIGGEFKCTKNITARKKYADISGYIYDTLATSSKGVTGYIFDTVTGDAQVGYEALNASHFSTKFGNWPVNPALQSFNIKNNKRKGTVSIEATYNNENWITGFREASYSIDYNPSIQQYATKASCNLNGLYGIYKLNVQNRQKVTLSETFKGGFVKTGPTTNATLTDYEKLASPYVMDIFRFYEGEIPFANSLTENESKNTKPAPHNEVVYTQQITARPLTKSWIDVNTIT